MGGGSCVQGSPLSFSVVAVFFSLAPKPSWCVGSQFPTQGSELAPPAVKCEVLSTGLPERSRFPLSCWPHLPPGDTAICLPWRVHKHALKAK